MPPNWYNPRMIQAVLLIPFKLLAFTIRLLVKIVLWPVKAIVTGLMLQIAMFLAFAAVLAVLGYFVYRWIT